MIATNGGGYYTEERKFVDIENALIQLGFQTTVMQTFVPTMGHRCWVVASLSNIEWHNLQISSDTKWINQEALSLLLASGKPAYPL